MVDINKKPAEYVGTNKRLLDRRLELDYSIKEACLKLDISTTKLHLIEKGYIKVSKKLQPKFIRKYELPEDFFTSDPYQYPTKIFKAEMEEEKAEKIRKLIIGWPFKIISLVLFAGGVAMGSYALTNLAKPMTETASFFPNTIVEQKQIIIDAIKKGDPLAKEHEMDASYTSSFMCADGFYSYEGKTSTGAEQFSIAVAYPKLEENLDFSFNYGSVNKFSPKYSNALYSYVFGDSVNNVKIESRLTRRKTRYTLEFTSVTLLGYITYDATIDRDDNGSYNVNIIYAGSGLIQEKVDKEKDILVWSAFEDLAKVTLDEYRNQLDTALQHPTLHSNLATYDNDLRTGVSSLNGYATLVDSLLLFGMVFGLLGLAAVIFSLILQFGHEVL